MRVIHLIDDISPLSYGLGEVCKSLAIGQRSIGIDSQIWSNNIEEDRSKIDESTLGITRFYPPNISPIKLSLRSRSDIKLQETSTVIHQHGIWTGKSMTSLVARRSGMTTVLAPHGSLQDWALKKSKMKKYIARLLYEANNIKSASGFHAVAEPEVADIRNIGVFSPIAVIPNGIDEKWIDSHADGSSFRSNYNVPEDAKILLFLSRITPKKGLRLLLESMSRLNYSQWVVVIAGGDEFGHLAEIQQLIQEENLANIIFTGALFGSDKREAFAAADAFILPSYSEGAPMVVLEALGAGVPVITTMASPWQQLETYNCGFWTTIDQIGVQSALAKVFEMSKQELADMGARGRALVQRDYSWEQSARMTLEFYAWLQGETTTVPPFVSLYR